MSHKSERVPLQWALSPKIIPLLCTYVYLLMDDDDCAAACYVTFWYRSSSSTIFSNNTMITTDFISPKNVTSPNTKFNLYCWLCLQGFASHLRISSRLHVHRLLCTLSAVSDRQSGGLIRSKGRFYSYINWVRFLVMLSFVVAVFHVWYICRYILVVSQRIIRHFMFQRRRMDCGCMEDWGSAHNSQLSV